MTALIHFCKQHDSAFQSTANTSATELTNYTINWSDLTNAGFAASDDVLLLVAVRLGNTSNVDNTFFQVGLGSTYAGRTDIAESLQRREPPLNNAVSEQYLFIDRRTLVSNENIYFSLWTTASTARANEFKCLILKLGGLSSTDFAYAEQTHSGNAPTTYDTSGASISTPDSGDWFFIGTTRWLADSTTDDLAIAIHDGSGDIAEYITETEDTADEICIGTFAYKAGLGASTTVRVRYRLATGTLSDCVRTAIFGLRLNAFQDHAGQHSTNTVTHSALDTYQEFAGFTFGLTTTGNIAVFGWPIHTTNETTKRPYGRIQIGGTDWPASTSNREGALDNGAAQKIAPLLFGYGSRSSGTLDIDLDCAEDTDITPNYSCTEQVAVVFSFELGAAVASGVGTSAGAGTTNAIGTSRGAGAGTASGTGATAVVGASIAAGTGTAAGVGVSSGVGAQPPTALAAVNTAVSLQVDTTYLVRARVENTGAVGGTGFKWKRNLNSAGWVDVTTTSAVVKAIAAAVYANDDDVPERLGGSGAYISDNNAASEDGTTSLTSGFTAGGAAEFVLAFQIPNADVVNNDAIQLRLFEADDTAFASYTQTPSITVVEAANEGAGTAAGVGSANAVGAVRRAGTGTATGTGAASAVSEEFHGGAGTAAGTGAAAGVGESVTAANTVEIGAVRWIASFAQPQVIAGVGTASGAGAASAVGRSTNAGAGTAAGVGTATGQGASTRAGTGTAAGIGSATAVGRATGAGAGTALGTGTAIGVTTAAGVAAGTGTATGTGVAAGVSAPTIAVVGTATGVGTASGVGREVRVGAGTAAGAGAATAVGRATSSSIGTASGVGVASAVGASRRAGTGTATGVGTATAVSTAAGVAAGTGTATGIGTASAVYEVVEATVEIGAVRWIASFQQVAPVSEGAGTATGIGTAAAVGRSINAGTGTATGVGTAAGVSTAAGVAAGAGTATGVGAASGVGASRIAAAGTALGQGAASASGRAIVARAGTATGVGTAIGVSQAGQAAEGTGTAAGIGTASAVSEEFHGGAGTAAGTGAAAGIGRSTAAAVGSTAGVGAAQGVGRSTNAGVGSAAGVGAAQGVGPPLFFDLAVTAITVSDRLVSSGPVVSSGLTSGAPVVSIVTAGGRPALADRLTSSAPGVSEALTVTKIAA